MGKFDLVTGEMPFYFEKSTAFRVIHVDGALGAISPGSRFLHMTVFSERAPLPKMVVQSITEGVLGEEIVDKRVGKTGVFRELEADLVMSIEAATALRDWLNARLDDYESIRSDLGGAQS